MLRDICRHFNTEHFSQDKYRRVLAEIQALAGDTCLRMCETPVFISNDFSGEIIRGAIEIIHQSMALKGKLDRAVPPEFNMPSAPRRPDFFIIDFAVTESGPQLIEMQAFASNLVFIPLAGKVYKGIYGLGESYRHLLCDMNVVKKIILGNHLPENVILMEIDPWRQQSRRDFVATQKWLGISVIDVRDVIKEGNRLFYRSESGDPVRIRRIYNRVVPTEFQSLHLGEKTQFRFSDPLEVEWAGDPGWFLRISKYAMPYLEHPMVPETRFLDEVKAYPPDLENYVLKPVFLNAGFGVKINITQADIESIALADRHNYILMRKVKFSPFVPDLKGNMLNAEIRIMFVWHDQLEPVAMSARVMRGNDTNENLWGDDVWCGLAPVLIVD